MRLQDLGKRKDELQIDPRLLKVQPGFNVRDLDSPDERPSLDELKELIRGVGVHTALVVRMVDDDPIIVSGHRRHKVVMELIDEGEDIKLVPVKPEASGTNDIERTISIVSTNSGKPLTPLQVAEVVRRLIGYGWDKPQIAKRLGWKSTNSVQQHLDLLAIPANVQAAAKASGVAATTLRKAVKELGPEETLKLIEADKAQGRKTKPRDVAKASGKVKPKADKLPVPPPRSQASVVENIESPPEQLAGIQAHAEQPAEVETQANGRDAELKHTPGPWALDTGLPGGVYSNDATGSIVARCMGVGFEFVARPSTESKANARLIALTPDLLKYVMSSASAGCATAKLLVARATGGEQS